MKKIVLLVLCIVTINCFAMNNDKKVMKERQTVALELLATAQALQTCLKLEKHNKTNTPQYTSLSCSSLREKFSKLVEKNNNHS